MIFPWIWGSEPLSSLSLPFPIYETISVPLIDRVHRDLVIFAREPLHNLCNARA